MPSKKKITKATAKPVEKAAPPPAPEAEQVVTPSLTEQFNVLLGQLSALRSQLTIAQSAGESRDPILSRARICWPL